MQALIVPRKTILACIVLWVFTSALHAATPDADLTIKHLYQAHPNQAKQPLGERIQIISAELLDKPYSLTALGEGPHGDIDQAPLYRMDAFDCETYVDTVLALALSHNIPVFKYWIQHIRYFNGQVAFIYRNHFTCLDWNKNNQQQGLLRDITETIHDEANQSIALLAKALIDKPSWYQHFSSTIIRLPHASNTEQKKRLAYIKEAGRALPKRVSEIPYIPLTALFDDSGQPNQFVFAQIPNAAIIEIVRPNWDLTKAIGTHLNVSHLGFAIWSNGTLFFRQASSEANRVIDIPLIDYLRSYRQSPTIKGINIQIALPQHVESKKP